MPSEGRGCRIGSWAMLTGCDGLGYSRHSRSWEHADMYQQSFHGVSVDALAVIVVPHTGMVRNCSSLRGDVVATFAYYMLHCS